MDGLPRRQGRSKNVLELFGEHYHDEIPSAHHRKNSSGRVQWIVRTQWARQKALNLGLIESPARGIWRLTDEGHRWLEEHQDATRLGDIESSRQLDSSNEPEGGRRANYKSWLSIPKSALESWIPEKLQLPDIKIDTRNDRLYIKIRAVKKCHYEIRLHPDYHEVALHFQNSKPERNQSLLRAFVPHLTTLTENIRSQIRELGEQSAGSFASLWEAKDDLSVQADTWGPDNRWGRVWIKLPTVTPSTSLLLGESWVTLKLIESTWDILKPAYESVRKGISPIAKAEKTDALYDELDRQIELIHEFLQGRSDSRPSDEKLCDWVQFCYSFELFKEGVELFRIVLAENVNPWYLERTKKLARICEMKVRG
jgi:hypothetical protein